MAESALPNKTFNILVALVVPSTSCQSTLDWIPSTIILKQLLCFTSLHTPTYTQKIPTFYILSNVCTLYFHWAKIKQFIYKPQVRRKVAVMTKIKQKGFLLITLGEMGTHQNCLMCRNRSGRSPTFSVRGEENYVVKARGTVMVMGRPKSEKCDLGFEVFNLSLELLLRLARLFVTLLAGAGVDRSVFFSTR